jgi:hypothetical protein
MVTGQFRTTTRLSGRRVRWAHHDSRHGYGLAYRILWHRSWLHCTFDRLAPSTFIITNRAKSVAALRTLVAIPRSPSDIGGRSAASPSRRVPTRADSIKLVHFLKYHFKTDACAPFGRAKEETPSGWTA